MYCIQMCIVIVYLVIYRYYVISCIGMVWELPLAVKKLTVEGAKPPKMKYVHTKLLRMV